MIFKTAGMLFGSLLFTLSCAHMNTENRQPAPTLSQDSAPSAKNGLHVLFLGDYGIHQPAERIQEAIPYLAKEGIYVTYTDRQEDLNPERLANFDIFMFYGNRDYLPPDQEKALLDFVHNGGGFVALHSASASFLNSDAFINLVGGAFNWHGGKVFGTERTVSDHPVFDGVPEFESWDETYVHVAHNPDRTVLSVQSEEGHDEPWTWVRNHGEGRVFYTAWGHDSRTWTNPGFQALLENGIRWAAGDDALSRDYSPPALTYGEGELPYYPPGQPWGTIGDPFTQVQNPFTPEEALEHIFADPAFRVEMFAADPDVINPIDMTWDEEGRLWVVETVDYPNSFTDNREGNDRIKVLEDTNGDGVADNITVFAEGLNIPTSLTLANGGVLVSQAPDILFFKDTTGDGKADLKETVVTGFGTFDTHAGPSNLHYGFDNQIWGVVGYSAFEGTVGGESHQFSQGIFRFTPEGDRMEFVSNTTNNTWGLGFSEEGVVFGSTANGNPAVHSAVPNRFYDKVEGIGRPRLPMIADTDRFFPIADSVRQVDHHGRFTSAAGFHLYTARDFPKEYWNRIAFVTEPTGHLMAKFIVEPDGSTFEAKNAWNFLASQDEWFSPIQAKVGPDGALWVIDWYNLVIQHNPTPGGWDNGEGNAYVNELRDREHARIYRVVYEGATEKEPLNLKDASADQLVSALSHDNLFWRLTAQRLLVERGETDILQDLYSLIEDKQTDELGLAPGALHALWTLDGLGQLRGGNREALEVATAALHHPAASVRRAALMALPRNIQTRNYILRAGFLPNPDVPTGIGYRPMSGDPQIRLAALLALGEMPASAEAGRTVAETILRPENVNDRWIRDAATAAGVQHLQGFMEYVMQRRVNPRADSTQIGNIQTVISRVSGHYVHTMNPQAEMVADFLLSLDQIDETIGIGLVQGAAEAWPETEGPVFSSAQRNSLQNLRGSLPESYDEALDLLAEKWEAPEIFGVR